MGRTNDRGGKTLNFTVEAVMKETPVELTTKSSVSVKGDNVTPFVEEEYDENGFFGDLFSVKLTYLLLYDTNGGQDRMEMKNYGIGMFELREFIDGKGDLSFVFDFGDPREGEIVVGKSAYPAIPTAEQTAQKIIFAGWSKTRHEGPQTVRPDDLLGKLTLSGNTAVYAVWAYDKNGNEIPDYDDAATAEEQSQLKAAIESAEKLDKGKYWDFSAVESALEAAKALDASANSGEVQAAKEAIEKAVAALKEKPDTAELEQAIEDAASACEGSARPAGIAFCSTLDGILNAAKAKLADKNATQKDIDEALSEIQTASALLEKLIDLNDAVQLAGKIARQPGVGYADLDGAVTAAKKLLDAANPARADVDAAIGAVGKAVAAHGNDAQKAALAQAVQAAEGLTRQPGVDYADVDGAIAAAKKLLDDPEATREAVEAAIDAVEKAVAAHANDKAADKTELAQAVEEAGKIEKETGAAYAAIGRALAMANGLLSRPDATQKEIDEAFAYLGSLVRLGGAVRIAGGISRVPGADYADVDEAVAAAEKLLDDPEASGEAVEAAIDAVEKAVAAHESDAQKAAGRTNLEQAIEDAAKAARREGVDYAALDKAVEAAKKLLSDPNASEETVEAATRAIREALAALDVQVPKTGDDFHLGLWLLLAVAAEGCCVLSLRSVKRGRKKD